MNRPDDILAMQYVIGEMPDSERQAVERRFAEEPAFQSLVLTWEERLAVNLTSQEQPAPTHIWDRIEAEIDTVEKIPGSKTVRDADGAWERLSDGVTIKHLFIDSRAGWRSFLLKLEPGARRPAHEHYDHAEECLILEGETEIGGVHFKAGDYHLAPVGVPHGELVSKTGALLYIRSGLPATA